MYAKLRMVGGTGDGDPYRVDMPNATMLEANYEEEWAIVAFSNRYGPPSLPQAGSPLYPVRNGRAILIGLSQQQLIDWYAKLRRLFPDPHPPYSPDFPA